MQATIVCGPDLSVLRVSFFLFLRISYRILDLFWGVFFLVLFYCITTNGAGTGYPSGASEFISIFMRFVFLIFCVVFCRSLFVPLLSFFLLHIELSAIRITAFDYPFGILKLFSILCRKHIKGILKLILVIFCMSWKLAIGSINDIYVTLTRFLSMKLCKSDIISW